MSDFLLQHGSYLDSVTLRDTVVRDYAPPSRQYIDQKGAWFDVSRDC